MPETTLSGLLDQGPEDDLLARGVIGPYRLISSLGRGGMGRVYHAEHRLTGRAVALKVVGIEAHLLRNHLEQVTQEAMAMAALRDPHIITCYSFGEDGNHLYLALELMQGGDTAGLVARQGGRLGEAAIRALATSCLLGLSAIHRARLVHRDIKPSNILLDGQGRAKLADFGLACFTQATGVGGNDQGTPAFMPPEAVTGKAQPDIRGDIYSLGVTMYYWATGASPFRHANVYTIMQQVLTGDAQPLVELRPDLSPVLLGVVATAMQLAPEQRFPDPEAMLRALKAGTAGALPAAAPAEAPVMSPSAPVARPANPRPRPSPVLGWVIAAVMAVGLIATTLGRGPGAGTAVAGSAAPPVADPATLALAAGYRLPWLGDALVSFHEHGAVAYARSGQVLTLREDAWLDGEPAPGVTGALARGDDFSIELTLQPANLVQEGPARIVGIGLTPRSADLMIGQSGSRVEVRVRTTVTNTDGTRPHLVSEDGALDGRWQHLVFVRRGHLHLLYLDGQERARIEVPGALAAWQTDYPVCVGNDHRGGFPWVGALGPLVVQTRAWTPDEVAASWRSWQTAQTAR